MDMRQQTFAVLLLCVLAFINAEHTQSFDEAFIVDFMHHSHNDIKKPSNSTRPEESLKIVVENVGWSSQDVAFDAFLPAKAELLSFSVSSNQQKYVARKINENDAKQLHEEAKTQDSNSAIYKPHYFDGRNLDEIQTNSETVHIRAQHKLSFELEYNSNLLRGVVTDEKLLDQAVIVVDLVGSSPSDLRAELSSPNYPDDYPNAANFAWLIRTQQGHRLRLSFTDVDMESCCDELVVYDGINSSSSVLAIISGQAEKSYVFDSHNNALMVVLKSDCSNSGRGFRGLVDVIPDYPDSTTPSFQPTTKPTDQNANCSGIYLHGNGRISSPNYPGNYSNNQNCSWQIHAHHGNSLVLDIYVEGIQYNDYLNIYDGYSSHDDRIGRITNRGSSYYNFFSNSNYMFITFTSDYWNTAGGFSISFREIEAPTTAPSYPITTEYPDHNSNCSGVHLHGAGTIYSPNYPYNYDNNQACSWLIHGDYDKTVLLDVYSNRIKEGDYLDIYDGDSIYDRRIARVTSSYSEHYHYNSTSNYMYIVFTSDYSDTGQGFFIDYTQVDRNIDCNGLHLHGSGTIRSPNYPYDYDNNQACSWVIHADYGKNIRLDVYVEGINVYDYLDIHDGSSSYDYRLDRLTSVYSISNTYTSSSNYMFVNFTSDPWNTASGFSFSYWQIEVNETMDQNANCSGIYLQGNGRISSPNYPGNYSNNQNCSWQIHAHHGNSFVLDIYVEGIQYNDYLNIYDGSSSQDDRIGRITNRGSSYYNFFSSSNYMFITFTSDSWNTAGGFSISFREIEAPTTAPSYPITTEYPDRNSNCSVVHLDGAGTIYSSNYPYNYDNNEHRCWLIPADFDNEKYMRAQIFGIESHYDRLSIYKGSSSSGDLVEAFDGGPWEWIYTTAYNTYIEFTSDGTGTGPGFMIQYEEYPY